MRLFFLRPARCQVASIIMCSLLLAQSAAAHSGGTNASGCHTDSSTGVYHCHSSSRSSSSSSFDGDPTALGLALAGTAGLLTSLFLYFPASRACAARPADEACGPKVAWWILTGVSAAFVVASLAVSLGGDDGSPTQAHAGVVAWDF